MLRTTLLIFFSLLLTSSTFAIENGDRASVLRESIWRTNRISVCWENPNDLSPTEMDWVKRAIADSWQMYSQLEFTYWGRCQSNTRGIRILSLDDSKNTPHAKALGRHINGIKNGMVLNFDFSQWATECQNGGATPSGYHNPNRVVATSEREYCVKLVAIHEFGHALGFAHEHNRSDAPFCGRSPQGTDGDWNITPYDLNSVMNYCNPNWAGNGKLSHSDKIAVRSLYVDLGSWNQIGDENIAIDIGVGANDKVWIIGTNGRTYYLRDNQWIATSRGTNGKRIDVDAHGNPWMINREGRIYRFVNGNWQQVKGKGADIGVGADGSVWLIGNKGDVYKLNDNSRFQEAGGTGVKIDVDNQGTPWVLDSRGRIHRRNNSGTWERLPGLASDIGICPDGGVWIVGNNGRIYRWVVNNWLQINGSAVNISCDSSGLPWVIGGRARVFAAR